MDRVGSIALGMTLVAVLVGCSPSTSEPTVVDPWKLDGRLIDLTHVFDESTVYWPTAAGFQLSSDFEGVAEGGYFYEANSFASAEHGGTHLDAPVHFAEGKHSTEQVPLDRLIGEAVIVDVSAQAAENADYLVTIADFEEWESRHGKLSEGIIVLIRTGFGARWPDAAAYLGTAERGAEAVARLHFPGIDPEAARWLIENRSIDAIGIDTASIDFGQSATFESHRILYAENIPGFENVANLDQLPEKGFLVIALPMKIGSGSGGPLRIVAIVP